ncbi:hypothetical protein DABAL43B_1315 [Psychrobacter sp. DAB_AL43B]|nr:hypothetical protein DABAL43B_1315 [Psychrobacter sp. DAB_AL43B]
MTEFIEVTDLSSSEKLAINTSFIMCITQINDPNCTVITTSDGSVRVVERYDDIIMTLSVIRPNQ